MTWYWWFRNWPQFETDNLKGLDSILLNICILQVIEKLHFVFEKRLGDFQGNAHKSDNFLGLADQQLPTDKAAGPQIIKPGFKDHVADDDNNMKTAE